MAKRWEAHYCGIAFALSGAVLGVLWSLQFDHIPFSLGISVLIGYVGGCAYGLFTLSECRKPIPQKEKIGNNDGG